MTMTRQTRQALSGARGSSTLACRLGRGLGRVELRAGGVHRRGRHVVAVVRMRTKGLGSGVELDRQDAVVYRCRNDKIIRADYYNSKEQALEAAGLAE